MRRSFKTVAAAVLVATALPGVAAAQNATATAIVDLNMRAGPAPYFPVVGVIPANEAVTLYGCTEELSWCDVSTQTVRGWSYAEYLTIQSVAIPQAETPPPAVAFEGELYFEENYRDRPFFENRDQFLGAAGGAAGGAIVGALLFGPIGAAVGAAAGGAAGAAVGEAITPPEPVVTFVTQQEPTPVLLSGDVVVGAGVPEVVSLQPVPDYDYYYAYINGQWVLVDPTTRQIVYIFR